MTTDTVGGVWSYTLELVDVLADHGVEVVLATMGAPLRPDQCGQLDGSRVAAVHESAFALEWMPDPWADVDRAGEWLLDVAADSDPDLVHLNGYGHAALPWGVPVLVVGHSDVLSWHDAVRGVAAGAEWGHYREAVAAGLHAAALLVAPTRALLDELRRIYEPPCPCLVVPNGIRRDIPPQPKRELVLTAGRVWDEAKNVQALARVAPSLPWPVAVAGEGERPTGVTALGRLDRAAMDEALATAAIFAEPALYEPFGLAAVEAGRAGCALVLGDIPSLREVWGDAALLVDPADDAALGSALASLIASPALRADYGDRARRRSLGYTAERMAAGYLDAYARVRRAAEVGA